MKTVREWKTPIGDSGRVLLNIPAEQIRNMSRNQLGDLYEQLAVEILHELGFSPVSRVNTFYDIEAQKGGKTYYIEVKGRISVETSYVSTQLEKLRELAETEKVCWIFITLETSGDRALATYSFEPFLV